MYMTNRLKAEEKLRPQTVVGDRKQRGLIDATWALGGGGAGPQRVGLSQQKQTWGFPAKADCCAKPESWVTVHCCPTMPTTGHVSKGSGLAHRPPSCCCTARRTGRPPRWKAGGRAQDWKSPQAFSAPQAGSDISLAGVGHVALPCYRMAEKGGTPCFG